MIIPNLHSICKRILAMVVVLVIFLKVFIIDVYALSAAPIMGEALVEVFSALLLASGYTYEEVGEMSWNDAETAINDGISSGTINPLQVVGDVTVNGVTTSMNFMEWLSTSVKATSDVVTSDVFGTITNVAVKTALSNSLPGTIGSWVNNLTQEDVVATPTTDIKGYGAKLVERQSDGTYREIYCDYIVIDGTTYNFYSDVDDKTIFIYYDAYGNEKYRVPYSAWSSINDLGWTYELYGDVRSNDGTQAPTDDETTSEVGETADGEKVTLEDIQSGAVSADDTTLDYDKFNDEAIIDLLQQILDTMENVPVVEENDTTYDDAKENIQAATGELDIAELNNLQMPLGIIDVFPFCLPFDFVRGMKLLSAKPETPYFEVNIVVPSFLGVPEQKWDFVIDFEMLEPVAKITRWTSLLAFSFVLIFLSTKIVKGAGS